MTITGNAITVVTLVDGDPHTASVSHSYHCKVRELERSKAVILCADLFFAEDVSRARSRAVWYALQRSECQWVLWWDEDVVVKDTQIVPAMLDIAVSRGYEFIAAPYPRKRIPAMFPYKPKDEDIRAGKFPVKDDVLEIDLIGFGFAMTSRKCLETMCEAYADEWFTDAHDPANIHETVGVFRQLMGPESTYANANDPNSKPTRFRELYSEDYSFCRRWRDLGKEIAMYLGPGSPLGHVGGHTFTGTREDAGRLM